MSNPVDLVFHIYQLRKAASAAGMLDMWTITDSPKDYPDLYVARRFVLDRPTDYMFVAETLDDIRKPLVQAGFTCMSRSDGDDPVIVETWL
jgi:hypothetical protein